MSLEHERSDAQVVDVRLVVTLENGRQFAASADSAELTIETWNTFFRNFQREIIRISSSETTIKLSNFQNLTAYHVDPTPPQHWEIKQ